MPLIRRVLALAAALLVLTVGACSPEIDDSLKIEVTGDFGRRPQVAFDAPLDVTESETRVLVEGEGTTLEEEDPVLLAFVAFSGESGEVLGESYDREPRALALTEEAGPLYSELLGMREGTRFLHLDVGTIARPEPVVLVYDVLHTQAWGAETSPLSDAKDLPTVSKDSDEHPVITIPDLDPPSQLRVVTLIKGTGPQVQEGGSLTAHYSTVEWSTGEEIDTTWADRLPPPSIPFTGLIPAWQDGLSDATVGSQVMIIAPPEEAFGSDTIVFVIDLLATTAPDNGNSTD